ncbi:ATP-binding cassette subfamily F protein uup [Stella humosa]|uniref:ATP-binding cassette subfamily F protein uup n=1 Tax=Stella humosa TaxID=94 RepID=A0A3N1LYV0_9PROT|nr:ATP-binding cassette domain-containing protein [Stella humosa]ROQ00404.1 ATP-binding cassette subfamily F protein uup [Stella humosa]BBK30353.1 ATP-binding protein [Stella humosa]
MSAPLLVLQDIHLTFGGPSVVEGADLSVAEGERLCLVGRNGSGKSTLLKVAAGLIEPDRGNRVVHQGAVVRYLPQEPDLSGYPTTLAYAEGDIPPDGDHHRARLLLDALGLTGAEDPRRLSGGEARRAALARVLAPSPDVLLLDEPTNHLDLPAIEWLEQELAGLRSAIVLISHDRRFLQSLSKATLWLDRGVTRRLEQGFGAFEEWRDRVLEEEETERHKLDRKIVDELHWVRYGVTARRQRNQGRMRALMSLRTEVREQRRVVGDVKMTIAESEVSGKLVAEMEGASKSFGDRAIVRNLSLKLRRGDRMGLVGPNGAGKTTLLSLLTGAMAPDSGSVRLGANVQMVTLDQRRETLDPTTTLKDALTGGGGDMVTVGGRSRHFAGYMQDFLFTPEQARTPVQALSGGERGRLLLARALALPSNLLVLDEPTNDLDLETLDLLQEMLADYPGTVLLVSHDRDFLDRVATSIVAYEGPAQWTEYAGGYSDMVSQRGTGVEARAVSRAPRAKGETAEPAAPRARKPRLGFAERRQLDLLPRRMAELEKAIAAHQATLAEPSLYARDRARFDAATAGIGNAQTELAAAEEEWLRLEMLREEIEG